MRRHDANEIVRAIAHTLEQSSDVDVNEIIIRLTCQELKTGAIAGLKVF